MMVNRNLLSSKLAELADCVARIRSLGKLSEEELTANRDAFDLASFNLMLAVQVCADIAAHLIADERSRRLRTSTSSNELRDPCRRAWHVERRLSRRWGCPAAARVHQCGATVDELGAATRCDAGSRSPSFRDLEDSFTVAGSALGEASCGGSPRRALTAKRHG